MSLARDLLVLMANPAWRVLAAASLLIYIALGMRGSVTIYYFRYLLDKRDLYGNFNATSMVAAMVGIFFSKSLTERFRQA